VQETSPAAASDQKGDEVASRAMVQDLHHAEWIRKAHTGVIRIEKARLTRLLSCFAPERPDSLHVRFRYPW
jgi:hypothetical protein